MDSKIIKIILVAGARPNFMKIAPILRAFDEQNRKNTACLFAPLLVHTGQHYDADMSDSFFRDLGIPDPDYHLGCGGGSHAEQTAKIMVEFEKLCLVENPDMVLVVGDVNSTIAAGLVAKKQGITLIHVEAGLRSRDHRMPEEINRLATDAITDIFFTTEKEGTQNLLAEGQNPEKVHFVGHVMVDNLFFQVERLSAHVPSELVAETARNLPGKYLCMTMHRPSNVDNKETLSKLLISISNIAADVPIIFPCHPRTRKQIEAFGLDYLFKTFTGKPIANGVYLYGPLGYNDFLHLWKNAAGMITDSGGLQEETTALGIPCVTIRENTERPITIEEGTNVLVGTDTVKLKVAVSQILHGEFPKGRAPEKWDGMASERIVSILGTYVHGK